MRVRKMTIQQGRRVDISRFPNFYKTGSVWGMKHLYYGTEALLVKCGNFIYDVSNAPEIYNQAAES